MSVVVETTLGVLTLDLYTEVRPQLTKNFLKLCKTKYYNLNLFHNVQRGFIAQTGDPTATGRGGQAIYADLYGEQARYLEATDVAPKIRHTRTGLVSMVAAGKGLFGSQFFITLADDGLDALDEEHCVIGEVVEGFEIIDKLNDVISDEQHRPYQDVRITHTVILDDPFEDPPGLIVPSRSPSPNPERLKTDRLAADADLSADEDLTAEELTEKMAAKEASAQATILEMVGDLPDADCAPPENVLFVCKLNPVTTDDDLEIIFSRFGRVVSCEVIRDHKTGDSLQYAFVEFEDQKACETAYFKMDNVLIDDRRIHVDFSQSVSKYRWKGKGRLEVLEDKDEPLKKKSSRAPERDGYGKKDWRDRSHRSSRDDRDGDRRDKERYERDRKRRKSRDRSHRSSRDDRDGDRRDKERYERDRKRKKSRDRSHRSSRDDRDGDRRDKERYERDRKSRKSRLGPPKTAL